MFKRSQTEKLFEVFRLALKSENVDLRDAVVTYLGMAELPGSAEIIDEYVEYEPIDWLKTYAEKVLVHLRARDEGKDSKPPSRSLMFG